MQFDISGLVTILEYNMLVFVIIYSMKWSDVFQLYYFSYIIAISSLLYPPQTKFGGI
jgi:hypothetical protein